MLKNKERGRRGPSPHRDYCACLLIAEEDRDTVIAEDLFDFIRRSRSIRESRDADQHTVSVADFGLMDVQEDSFKILDVAKIFC